MITVVPTAPKVGDKLDMFGGVTALTTVKVMPLLAMPSTVTTTFPGPAPAGTGAVMLVLLKFVGAAAVPLKLTVLPPWVLPKLVPVMLTEIPTKPTVGGRPVMLGAGVSLSRRR
jgi:hypothetical protein